MSKIKSGCLVSVNPDFIKEFGRDDLKPDDTYKVVKVIPVCGERKVATLINTRTLSKIDLFTCNLIPA